MDNKTVDDRLFQIWGVQGEKDELWRPIEESYTHFYDGEYVPIHKIGYQKTSLEETEERPPYGKRLSKLSMGSIESLDKIYRPKRKRISRLRKKLVDSKKSLWYSLKPPMTEKERRAIEGMIEKIQKEESPEMLPTKTYDEFVSDLPERRRTVKILADDYDEIRWDELKAMRTKNKTTRPRRKTLPKTVQNPWPYINERYHHLSWALFPMKCYEPLTTLQRMAEDFEYSWLLDVACAVKYDDAKRMGYVAAFSATPLALAPYRLGLPFPSYTGETYELDRMDDLGWKLLAEQVSEMPSISVLQCVSAKWVCKQHLYEHTLNISNDIVKTQRTSEYLLILKPTCNKYTWIKKIDYTFNRVEKRIVLNDIRNYDVTSVDDSFVCRFIIPFDTAFNYKKQLVKGLILGRLGTIKWLLEGLWNKQLKLSKVKQDKQCSAHDFVRNPTSYLYPGRIIWKLNRLPENFQHIYFLSTFACQLNEFDPLVPPNDSRRRPDVRAFENGDWSLAAKIVKRRLESEKWYKLRQIKISDKDFVSSLSTWRLDKYRPYWFSKVIVPKTYKKVKIMGIIKTYILYPIYLNLAPTLDPREELKSKRQRSMIEEVPSAVRYQYQANPFWDYWYLEYLQDWRDCPDVF